MKEAWPVCLTVLVKRVWLVCPSVHLALSVFILFVVCMSNLFDISKSELILNSRSKCLSLPSVRVYGMGKVSAHIHILCCLYLCFIMCSRVYLYPCVIIFSRLNCFYFSFLKPHTHACLLVTFSPPLSLVCVPAPTAN